jgi:hypothetical protein
MRSNARQYGLLDAILDGIGPVGMVIAAVTWIALRTAKTPRCSCTGQWSWMNRCAVHRYRVHLHLLPLIKLWWWRRRHV